MPFRTRFSSLLTALCIVISLSPSFTLAQEVSALINQALDRPVNLQLDTTLPQAMAVIADKTGVKIEADREVWELLPYGEQTAIKATIANTTLRAAIDAIARELGLVSLPGEFAVTLRPMPALKRLSRRATDREIEALSLLTSTPLQLPPAELKNGGLTVEALVGAIDHRLVELKAPFAVDFRAGDAVPGTKIVALSKDPSLAAALEAITNDTDATWYPWGTDIVILPKEDQVRNLLNKTLSVRYSGADVAQVLTELSQRAGVEFDVQAGAVQQVPPEFRNVRLVLDNATIRQALEQITAFTGLEYVVSAKGVYVWNPSGARGGGGSADPVIATIPLDGGGTLMLRQSEVPDDLRQYLLFRKRKQLDAIRKQMQQDGFKPTTKPASSTTQNDL